MAQNAHDLSMASRRRSTAWLENIGMFILLAATLWVARYWYSSNFGFYEDDFTRIPLGMQMTGADLWHQIAFAFAHFIDHGVPLHSSLIYFFAFLGERLGGLWEIYWIGFVNTTLNCILAYLLLKRLSDRSFALLGALAYALFSADTTQAFLTHSLGLQPSMTFLLLAFHSYLFGRQRISYLLVLGILICYETPYPIFLAAPLLLEKWDRDLGKKIVKHALILSVILAAVIIIRLKIGESRVSGLTFPLVIMTPLLHMLEGPLVSLGTYIYRPVQALRILNREIIIAIFAAFPVFLWVAAQLNLKGPVDIQVIRSMLKDRRRLSALPEEIKAVLRLAVTGVVMLILAYPLTFTVRAYAISGRDTRVHFAAVLGASILCACGCWLVLYLATTYRHKLLGTALLAAFFSLLVGYGFVVQRDYRTAWDYQRQFWTGLVHLIPDASNETVILVEPDGLKDTRQIGANTWNLPRVLNQIYKFPANWKEPPRVYRLVPGWQDHIVTKDGQFQINEATTTAPPSLYKVVDSSDVILIETNSGRLERSIGPLEIGGRKFLLKAPSTEEPQKFDEGFLFKYLVQE